MPKDYFKVEPDRVALLGRNQNIGRGGRKIRYITRHHTAGVLNADQINAVWRDRPASAHYLIDPNGIVSQHVWDANTAWSNANSVSNQESITIEHSNSAGPAQDWPINPVTVDEGARWAAALCRYYNIGRPEYGKNIRDHREFTSTSCPYHLANGGKYHARYMQVAQAFYDELTNPAPSPEEDDMAFTEEDRRMLREVHRELTQLYPSRSAYRTTDEPIDTLAGYMLNADARIHEDWVHARAAEAGMDPADWAAKHLGGQA